MNPTPAYTRPCATASRSTSLIRVCQPRPDARKASITSGERRSVMERLGLSSGGRPIRFCRARPSSSETSVIVGGLLLSVSAAYSAGGSTSRAGRARANQSSSSSRASGSASIPAWIMASSSGVGQIVPGLSFGIAFYLPGIGFTKTDDAFGLTSKTKYDNIQALTDIPRRLKPLLTITKARIFLNACRIPLEMQRIGQRNPMLITVDGIFGGVEFDTHELIVTPISQLVNNASASMRLSGDALLAAATKN